MVWLYIRLRHASLRYIVCYALSTPDGCLFLFCINGLHGWIQKGLLYELLGLLFLVLSGAVIYGVASYLFKLQELKVLADRFLKRA